MWDGELYERSTGGGRDARAPRQDRPGGFLCKGKLDQFHFKDELIPTFSPLSGHGEAGREARRGVFPLRKRSRRRCALELRRPEKTCFQTQFRFPKNPSPGLTAKWTMEKNSSFFFPFPSPR